MIPTLINDTKSNAEKTIFRWLRDDPKTNDWIVLHSYPLFQHATLISGEADFLILAPKLGVFVLEVKGGLVERINGLWYFTGKDGKRSEGKKRGPFEQGEEGIQSVMSLIKNKYGPNSINGKLLFGYGCVFPDMIFNCSSPEFDSKIIFDQRNGSSIGDFVINLSKFWKNKFENTYGVFSEDKLITKQQAKEISSFLRPNFEDLSPLKRIFDSTDKRIERLTNEQYMVLDGIEDNKRSLILGSAGTGKTVLAIQSLLRHSMDKNLKIGFFCFNNLLGEYLRQKIDSSFLNKKCYIGTIHSYLLSFLSKKKLVSFEENDDQDFFDHYLPELFIEHYNDDFSFECFDMIIVDEAQDLVSDDYLMVFDCMLKNGISLGKWQFFADFENQDINSKTHVTEAEAREKLENSALYRLTINCRNTHQICKEIETIANVKYKTITNQIDGIGVDHIEYSSIDDGAIKFDQLIDKLKKNNVDLKNVIVLSQYKKNNSFIAKSKYQINDYKLYQQSNGIQFATIQSFKGLESQVVIITDVDGYDKSKLLYVGVSRAKSALYIFETESAHMDRLKMVVEKL